MRRRGAASVPSGQPPYRHPSAPPMQQQPMQSGKQPEGSGGRQVLIVLAVVLALLVLLCAGVISFLLKQGNAAMGESGPRTTVVHAGAVEPRARWRVRLTKQAAAPLSRNHATEGRQTAMTGRPAASVQLQVGELLATAAWLRCTRV